MGMVKTQNAIIRDGAKGGFLLTIAEPFQFCVFTIAISQVFSLKTGKFVLLRKALILLRKSSKLKPDHTNGREQPHSRFNER